MHGNGNEYDGIGISIFTKTFPFPLINFQFSVFMHVRRTCRRQASRNEKIVSKFLVAVM